MEHNEANPFLRQNSSGVLVSAFGTRHSPAPFVTKAFFVKLNDWSICAMPLNEIGYETQAYVLEMVRRQRSSLGPVIELFPKEVFGNVMKDLGLTGDQQQLDWREESLGSKEILPQQSEAFKINENGTVGFEKNTALSTSLENLLETSAFADLVFVVSGDSSNHVDLNAEPKNVDQAVVFRAHRVVVATRCNWFRIALGSGMKESSERKNTFYEPGKYTADQSAKPDKEGNRCRDGLAIVAGCLLAGMPSLGVGSFSGAARPDRRRKFQIEGCDPEIFGLFLRYLYTGHIADIDQLSVQQVASILTLADRYEVEDLLQLCERRLVASINDENVLFLVALADSISAVTLKSVALSHIKKEKQKILGSEDFASLPEDLKNELRQIETDPLFDNLPCAMKEGSKSPGHFDCLSETQLSTEELLAYLKVMFSSD
eukprot:gene9403-17112_t